MRSIESEGDSIDEAIDKALRALELDRERVQIEILSDATRGLFGFGGKKARVRATVRAPIGPTVDDAPPAVDLGPRETTPRREPPSRPAAPPRAIAQTPSAAPASSAFLAQCQGLLAELLGLLGVSCTIEALPGEEAGSVVLHVAGDSGGLLIGRRGQTLDALE